MNTTVSEVLHFVEENDVKFARLCFAIFSASRKIFPSSPRNCPCAFESGISFDASAVKGFMNVEESDLSST